MKEFVCIVCPRGCRIKVEEKGDKLITKGNSCPRGMAHAINEYHCPMRMLTSTVEIVGADIPRLPVISSVEIPKSKINECLDEIYSVRLTAPVREGEVLIHNVCNTGADIISARDLDKKA